MKFKSVSSLADFRELREHLNDALFRNSFYMMMTDIFISIFGFLFWIFVTRNYIPNDVGLATATLSVSQFIAVFSGAGLGFGLIQYVTKRDDKQGMINSCFSMACLSSILFTAIFLGGLGYLSPRLLIIRQDVPTLFSFILLSVIYSIFTLQGYVFIAYRSTKFYFYQNFIFNILRVPLVIILAKFGLFGIIFSWTVSIFISFMISFIFFIPKVQSHYKPRIELQRNVINDILIFSLGNYLAGILGTISYMIMPLIIVNTIGAEKAAFFYMAYSIGAILSIIPSGVTTSLYAESSYDQKCIRLNIIKSLKFISLFLIPGIVFLLLLGDKVLLIFGKLYSENATALLWFFGFSTIPYTVIQVYMTVKRIELDIKSMIYVNMLISLLIISMSYILMMKIGLDGIGIAWVLGYGLPALIIGMSFIKKNIDLNI